MDNEFERGADTSMETQSTLIKLLAKVESMETNIQIQQQAIIDKIGNIDEKLANRIRTIEEKFEDHIEESDAQFKILGEHTDKLRSVEPVIARVQALEASYSTLEERTHALEDAPKVLALNVIKSIAAKIGWIILGAIGAILIYVFTHPAELAKALGNG